MWQLLVSAVSANSRRLSVDQSIWHRTVSGGISQFANTAPISTLKQLAIKVFEAEVGSRRQHLWRNRTRRLLKGGIRDAVVLAECGFSPQVEETFAAKKPTSWKTTMRKLLLSIAAVAALATPAHALTFKEVADYGLVCESWEASHQHVALRVEPSQMKVIFRNSKGENTELPIDEKGTHLNQRVVRNEFGNAVVVSYVVFLRFTGGMVVDESPKLVLMSQGGPFGCIQTTVPVAVPHDTIRESIGNMTLSDVDRVLAQAPVPEEQQIQPHVVKTIKYPLVEENRRGSWMVMKKIIDIVVAGVTLASLVGMPPVDFEEKRFARRFHEEQKIECLNHKGKWNGVTYIWKRK